MAETYKDCCSIIHRGKIKRNKWIRRELLVPFYKRVYENVILLVVLFLHGNGSVR